MRVEGERLVDALLVAEGLRDAPRGFEVGRVRDQDRDSNFSEGSPCHFGGALVIVGAWLAERLDDRTGANRGCVPGLSGGGPGGE